MSAPGVDQENDPETLIRLAGAGRRYDSTQPEWALQHADLVIHRGDFVAISGPSGAGKSTLLNCLALLDTFDAGEYELDGQRVDQLSNRAIQTTRGKQFGFVFQSANAIESRSVAKNVEIPLASLGVPIGERIGLVTAALRSAKILHRANQNVSLLSGGEKQRVAIARALVGRPQVLFLDEPTGNLDSKNTAAVVTLLKELNQQGTTIVFVTHDEQLAAAATRRILVSDGLVSEPTPRAQKLAATPQQPPPQQPTPQQPPPQQSRPPRTQRTRSRTRAARRFLLHHLDAVSEGTFSLLAHPSRTLMALISIGLGVAGLVAGVNLGGAATNQIDTTISATGSDRIDVRAASPDNRATAVAPASTGVDPGGSIHKISALSGVLSAGSYDQVSGGLPRRLDSSPDAAGWIDTRAISSGTFAALGTNIAPHISALFDLAPANLNIAVVGDAAAQELDLTPGAPQTFFMGTTRFDVVAVVHNSRNSVDVSRGIFLSQNAASSLGFSRTPGFMVATKTGHADAVAQAIPYQLDAANPARFSTAGNANLHVLRQNISGSLNQLLLALAGLLLSIAILSTSSTLTNSVLQRSGEIGLRMATGSSRTKIAGLFVTEGAILGLTGGLLGSTAGVVIALVVAETQGWQPSFDPTSIVAGMVAGFLTGAVAAIIPGLKASKIQPAIAVRKS